MVPSFLSEKEFFNIFFNYINISEEDLKEFAKKISQKNLRWLATHHPDNKTRRILFEQTNIEIGEGTVININFIVSDNYQPLLRIGKRVAISPNVTIICASAPNNSQLVYNKYVKNNLIVEKEVIIMDDVWIGAGAIIMPGITIGSGSIIGAGALVNKNVDPETIVAGIPATIVRNLVT
jgi:acetyltransferase-like isoleucine patch superfamily enzyme